MVRVCAFPKCKNRMARNTPHSFHRLPLSDCETLKLWLTVLQMDVNTPVQTLRLADHRICSEHFIRDDYCQPKKRRHPIPKHFYLKKTAVPRVGSPAADRVETSEQTACTSAVSSCGAETQSSPASATSEGGLHPQQQDACKVKARSVGRVRSTDTEENVPETLTATIEKPARHHIVDEEAILQLMKNCPMCDRKCRCRKHAHGPYLVVYQSCYFCHYQRKWGSQPEAGNMNACHTAPKKKRKTKKKVSGNAKAPPSLQPNKTDISESSESQEPSKT